MNGKEALEKINAKYPKVKVIIMSQYFNDAYIIEFIRNGACAFLPKNCDIDKIVDAITTVYELGHYYDNKVSAAMAALLKKTPIIENTVLDTTFTKQELKIIKMICNKKSSIDISEELNVSIRTIEGHRHNISKKTNTNNKMDLIEYAKKNGLNVL
jgi:DNA-binding NarL/FixJ family response regulator